MFHGLKLRKVRLIEEKNLNENKLCLFKHITQYIKATDLTYYEKEEALQQILDMLLQAQYKNKDNFTVVGDDYKEFCNEICSGYKSNKSTFFIILNSLGKYLFWFIFALIGSIIANKLYGKGDFKITFDDLFYANYFAIIFAFMNDFYARAFTFVPINRKHIFIPVTNSNSFKHHPLIIVFKVIFISGFVLPSLIKFLCKIDYYTYFIDATITISILVLLLTSIISIEVYKFNYNKRL